MLTREAQEAYYGADNPGVATYMAPEVLEHFENYTAATDMWSLGCLIAFVMRKGEHVFNSNDDVLYYETGMGDMIFSDKEISMQYSTHLQGVVYSLLQVLSFEAKLSCFYLFSVSKVNPKRRPSAEEVFDMCTTERCSSVGDY